MLSDWEFVMKYGSDEPVQRATDSRKLMEHDLVEYNYPAKVDQEQILRCFYNNINTISTSIWRLVARCPVPWLPELKPKPLWKDADTAVPRRLIAAYFSDLFPAYSNPKARVWWQKNIEQLSKKFGGSYLKDQIGSTSRSTGVATVFFYNAPLDSAGVTFALRIHALLGYPDDAGFRSSFSTHVYLSQIEGKTLKDKATVLTAAPKHLRHRFTLVNDSMHSLKDCVRVAEIVGCCVAVHATNFVKHDGGPVNLKDKLVLRAQGTTRHNDGSSAHMNVIIEETVPKRIAKLVTYYAKLGNVVLKTRAP